MQDSNVFKALKFSYVFSITVSPNSIHISGNRVFNATGQRLTLTCTTGSSNPQSTITWYNGTTKISNSQEVTYSSGEYNGQVSSQELWLYPSRHDDYSNISCSAGNNLPGKSSVTDTVMLELNCEYISRVLREHRIERILFSFGHLK